MVLPSLADFPALVRLTSIQLEVWPEHHRFLETRFKEPDDLVFCERIAGLILDLAGDDLESYCADYRWTCRTLLEEELFFRRNGRYRRSTFAEAERDVYGDAELMARYMNGLLLSQALWSNHTGVLAWYAGSFLPNNGDEYAHLEVGPGHGLLLYLAARDPRCGTLTAWDVSAASLQATRKCVDVLGVTRSVQLEERSVLEPPPPTTSFDSIVISEVLEHLEDPALALSHLKTALEPNGRLFVNMPVNSPAPDHIYLLRSPEEVRSLVEEAGYRVLDARHWPGTGVSEERARKKQLTMSCGLIASVELA